MSSASTKVNEDPALTEDEFRSQEEGGEIAIESEEAEEEDLEDDLPTLGVDEPEVDTRADR